MLMTNSPLASTFKSVSFLLPSRRFTTENTTVGGCAPTPLKNENGARFGTPPGESVLTQPIGRGVMSAIIRRYVSFGGNAAGSRSMAAKHTLTFGGLHAHPRRDHWSSALEDHLQVARRSRDHVRG